MKKRLAMLSLAFSLLACGGQDLDRKAALSLVQGKVLRTIRMTIAAQAKGAMREPYLQLRASYVLLCEDIQFAGEQILGNCRAGEASEGNITNEVTMMRVAIGDLVPSAITGITKTGESTAAAQVALTFKPSKVYSKYGALFDKIEFQSNAAADARQPHSAEATFQRYDDGWRLTAIR